MAIIKMENQFVLILWISTVLFYCLSVSQVQGEGVISLTDANVNEVLSGHDTVLVNFYADWCRFSQILKPVFDEAGQKVADNPEVAKRIVFARVDCDSETSIASRYRINKYPTLKLFRNGNMVKKEYRGQRSADALYQYAEQQAKDPIEEVASIAALDDLDSSKLHILGFFETKDSDNYRSMYRVANVLRDECAFRAVIGEAANRQRVDGDYVLFRPANTKTDDVVYKDDLQSFPLLYNWAIEKCMPLVREITFENAEELTEEGLPFLILFHDPSDKEVIELFKAEVSKQLTDEKANINFLTADGHKFAHPLHHLGKSPNDLPVLAIDSFKHMYLFPHNVKEHLPTPNILKKFIEDLHSGKLHREFHHGPDPTASPPDPPEPKSDDGEPEQPTKNIPRSDDDDNKQRSQPPKITSPPKSTFRKLAPSSNRYTILRDEL